MTLHVETGNVCLICGFILLNAATFCACALFHPRLAPIRRTMAGIASTATWTDVRQLPSRR
eukprot:gene43562-61435_t